ncbi:MAG TPA: LysM peptidoglycan-binding domain-containing protein [Flavobacteriales bacterium]|nr:LysM peptidoglycan-binding domain-containing protein [Flavobacteriales bacterium]HMR28134.1 LysM peptidoglycan-binding domain-containing protein [Flavobacteriales bacterium]
MMRPLALLLVLLLTPALLAQEVRVVDGKRYVVHTVVAGQTLYGISRHYAVPVADLTAANPAAAQGLSIGQVLLIPQDAVDRKELRSAPKFRATGELVHTVAKKETLFGIAQRYGVEQTALIERNPELVGGLKAGMELVIPPATSKEVPVIAAEPARADNSRSHLVLAGETLFSLGKRYGVTIEALKEANGGLAEGLKVGTYLRIPAPPEPEPVLDTVRRPIRYQVGLLLPLCLDRNDSVHSADPDQQGLYTVTDIAGQFLAGARMAIDSMARTGMQLDVHLHDVGEDATTWGPVLRKGEMRTMDLFIGPFHRGAIDQLAAVVRDAHIVCPVPQSNKVILGHPQVSKVISGRPDLVQHMGRYAGTKHARENLILLRPDLPAEKELQDQLLRAVQAALAERTDRLRDSALVARPGKRDLGDLTGKLDLARLNVLLVPSEDVEFVSSLVTRLTPLVGKYRIAVFGMPAWSSMDVLEPGDLNKLDLHVPAATHIDRDAPAVRAFTERFRVEHGTDAGPYAFLGFDVTMYYLTCLKEEGMGFPDRFDLVATSPLHMGFRMRRMGIENGFGNESALMLEYRDLGVHPAR